MSYYQLLAAVIMAWGMGSVFYKVANTHVKPIQVAVISTCVYVVTTSIYYLSSKTNLTWNSPGIIYSVMGAVAMGIGSLAYFYLLQKGQAGEITVLTALYPAVTLILSCVFLHEGINLKKVCGLCLALVSVYLLKK